METDSGVGFSQTDNTRPGRLKWWVLSGVIAIALIFGLVYVSDSPEKQRERQQEKQQTLEYIKSIIASTDEIMTTVQEISDLRDSSLVKGSEQADEVERLLQRMGIFAEKGMNIEASTSIEELLEAHVFYVKAMGEIQIAVDYAVNSSDMPGDYMSPKYGRHIEKAALYIDEYTKILTSDSTMKKIEQLK